MSVALATAALTPARRGDRLATLEIARLAICEEERRLERKQIELELKRRAIDTEIELIELEDGG